MTVDSAVAYEGWAILELMGHRKLGGYISEAQLGGGTFTRIDIPSEEGVFSGATQFYGPSSIYCITATTEEIAKGVAARNRPRPAQRFELPSAVAEDKLLEQRAETRGRQQACALLGHPEREGGGCVCGQPWTEPPREAALVDVEDAELVQDEDPDDDDGDL